MSTRWAESDEKSVLLIFARNANVIKMGVGRETCQAAFMRLLAARHCGTMCLRPHDAARCVAK